MIKEEFLSGVSNWDNHRYLLWPALEATNGQVIEMGMGYGSTPFLNKYCKQSQRQLLSFENDKQWFDQISKDFDHKMTLVNFWEHVYLNYPKPDVILLDHAPGERRKIDLQRFAETAKIVILHDSEPVADHGYQCRQFFKLYKYKIDFESEGAWASALSNFINVGKWEIKNPLTSLTTK